MHLFLPRSTIRKQWDTLSCNSIRFLSIDFHYIALRLATLPQFFLSLDWFLWHTLGDRLSEAVFTLWFNTRHISGADLTFVEIGPVLRPR